MELKGFRFGTEGFLVWNLGFFGVELRVFWCGTEGVFVLK